MRIVARLLQAYRLTARLLTRMLITHDVVFFAELLSKLSAGLCIQQLLTHTHCTTCVGYIHHGRMVVLFNFYSSMRFRGGRAANKQRQVELQPLHFLRHVHHFIKRRGNEPRQPNHVDVFFFGFLQDTGARHHHAHVDNFKVITLQNHTHNVFTNVMNIAFHGREQDFTVALLTL